MPIPWGHEAVLQKRLALRISWSCLQVCSLFHRVLRCCFRAGNPVWSLGYLNYTLVTWKFLCFYRKRHSDYLPKMPRRHQLPSAVSKGERRLVCPTSSHAPPLLTVEVLFLKLWCGSHDEAKHWTDEKLRWNLRVLTRICITGDSVCKPVVKGLAPALTSPGAGEISASVEYWRWGMRGSMEGSSWVRIKKQFIEAYQVLWMLIKRWDIYIFYPIEMVIL